MQMQVAAGNSCTIIYLFSIGEDSEGKMMQSMVLHFLLSYRSAVVCLFALIIASIYSREALKASARITDQIGSLSALASSRLCSPHIPSFNFNTNPLSTLKSQSLKASRSYFLFFVFLLLTPPPLFSPLPAHTLPQPAQPSQVRNPSAYSDPTGDNRLPLVVYPIMASPHPPPASSPPSSF